MTEMLFGPLEAHEKPVEGAESLFGTTTEESQQKKRGRPRKAPEQASAASPAPGSEPEPKPLEVTVPARGGKGRKRKIQLEEEVVAEGVCAVFGFAELSTGHQWWRRSREEVKPISEPLTRMLNRLPPETLAMVEKYADPIALVIGCATVAGPAVLAEWELRQMRKERREQNPSPLTGSPRRPNVSTPDAVSANGGSGIPAGSRIPFAPTFSSPT